jgi:hypothetical protein
MKRPFFAGCLALALVTYAGASAGHTMWINLVPAREDRQVLVSIGYGDFLPGSELLSTDWGQMRVARYEAIAPDGKRSGLAPPAPSNHAKESLPSGLVVQRGGDSGSHRLQYPSGSVPGTYQVAAQSDLFRYIEYRDKSGEDRYTDRPLAELVDVDRVLSTSREIFFMKTAFAVGGWTDPAPVGHYLEIVPLSDLSALRPGDTVRFKVLLDGKSWNPAAGAPQISAHSPSFGDGWGLVAPVKYGEAEFRLPNAGMWRIEARVQGKSRDHPGVAGSTEPDEPIYIESTFVLQVRP